MGGFWCRFLTLDRVGGGGYHETGKETRQQETEEQRLKYSRSKETRNTTRKKRKEGDVGIYWEVVVDGGRVS